MAQRDHSLDERIITAAREAFLEKGYQGASLRKIAERAGVTVGAIQTRYKSKDALFTSLLEPFLQEIQETVQSIKVDYYTGAEGALLDGLQTAMKQESQAILHLIFDHYEDAVLLLQRSGGSSLEDYFDRVVQQKIADSKQFFHEVGDTGVDETLLGLRISAQFDGYRRIIRECADRQSAERYMNAVMTYHHAGWMALFALEKQRQEGTEDEV